MAMTYGIQSHPIAEQLAFLDSIASSGFKIMYSVDVFNATALNNSISTFKDHKAILGWYLRYSKE